MPADIKMCVVIPVHKPQLTADEQVSLWACTSALSNYDSYLLHPEGMDTSAYTAVYPQLILQPVAPYRLASIQAYNKLKIDLDFYQLFAQYTHLLTYELDAYIFDSDLEAANAFKFDFIGAPFFEGYWEATPDAPFIPGCNSGFSVRSIPACMRVLKKVKQYKFYWMLYKVFLSRIKPARQLLNRLTKRRYEELFIGRFSHFASGYYMNEDLIWTEVVPILFPSFTIADPISAIKFSFEFNLPRSLKLNGGKLPLGCHAWHRNPGFWKNFIPPQHLTDRTHEV